VGPVSSSRFGHYYDVSKRIPRELLESSKWHGFFLPERITSDVKEESCSLSQGYMKLLQFIQNIIYTEGFDGSNPQCKWAETSEINNFYTEIYEDHVFFCGSYGNRHVITVSMQEIYKMKKKVVLPRNIIENNTLIVKLLSISYNL
ncbi:hypothetical protein HispidOSU_006988, partial [Sigmodon hispidus]